ncbi:MAG: hypothetical protein M1820_007871 [Bogoriella megaspora]|nr:MAG: hypothetical protein M1820_007871 [Bogoriella megaspora]
MFENQSPMGSQKFLEGFFSPHSTPISSFNVQGPELEEIRKAFIALRSLRLPFHFFTQYESLGMHGQMLPRLLADAVNITHLMVSLTKYDEIGELGKYPYEGREEEVEAEFERETRSNFQILFQTLHLPNLVQLDLRSWKCSSQEIRTLLERHSATLRELRLYDMYLIKGQWYSLARRLGRKLMLTGVDLHSLGRALETPLHYFNEPDETGEIYHEPEIDICISGERIKASLTTILNHRYYPTQLLLHGRRNRMKRERDEAQNFNVEEDRQEEIYSWRDKPRFW